LFYIKNDTFLNPKKQSFYAPPDIYQIISFNLTQSRELNNNVIVALNYKEDFNHIDETVDMIKELRNGSESNADQEYFLFNFEGYMERIE